MKSSVAFAGLVLAAITVWVSIPQRTAAAGSGEASRESTLSTEQLYDVPAVPWTGRTEAFGEPGLEKAAGKTIPTFTRTIIARGRSFHYTMVGTDPFVRQAQKTVIPVEIIPVRFEFDDGSVFDPTLPNLPCAGPGTALDLTLASPVFQDTDYGEGNRQFVEEFRRLEFWKHTGAPGAINPGYSVRVAARVLPTIVVKPKGFFTQSSACGRYGLIDRQAWDAYARTLLPQLRSLGVTPRTFPLFLFANVIMFFGERSNCCEFGYHSAFNSEGIQTYGVANYDANGNFKDFPDVSVLSHELAEWYDDPFGKNATPPWGHTGQVKKCQSTLEVGDPLSGSLNELHEVPMPNGVTYHPQELAFFSWFFNLVPSQGFDGWYSSRGTFLAPANLCSP